MNQTLGTDNSIMLSMVTIGYLHGSAVTIDVNLPISSVTTNMQYFTFFEYEVQGKIMNQVQQLTMYINQFKLV